MIPLFSWDTHSDQPHIIPRTLKKEMRRGMAPEIIRQAGNIASCAPLLAPAWHQCRKHMQQAHSIQSFIGLAIGLDTTSPETLIPLIQESGVRHLLLRIPVWHRHQLAMYTAFMRSLPECSWTVCIMQNRESVCIPTQWKHDCARILTACRPYSQQFQIGQAPNRIKWGCAHMGDYLNLFHSAQSLRDIDPSIQLIGPGILDFEPQDLIRALHNKRDVHYDIVGIGLYVDRRGPPTGKQYGFFNLERKLHLFAAIIASSHRCNNRLWITETNWPISDTGKWAPASEEYRVSEDTYADYMEDYFRIAWNSKLVERVYWWQPVARGYGLIDDRDLRKRTAWGRLCDIIADRIIL